MCRISTLLALGLFLLSPNTSQARQRFPGQASWRKNPTKKTSKTVTAALTSDNCTGASQSLSDGTSITWTRATTATCTKNDGTLTTVSSGQPRCNSSGCLVEPAATNLVLQSGDFSNAAWNKALSTVTSAASAIGLSFWNVATSATTGATYEPLTVTSSTGPWTASAWMRAPSGTVTPTVGIQCGSGNANTCTCTRSDGAACSTTKTGAVCLPSTTIGTTPIRVAVTATCVSAQTTITTFMHGAQYNSTTGNADFAGFQFETGSVATSYIPTTSTSVTRNADVASFTKPAWLTDTQGCIASTILIPSVSGTPRFLSFGGTTGELYANSATSIRVTDNTNTVSSTVTAITNRSFVSTASWTGSALTLTADGVSSSGSYDGSITGSTISVGSTGGSSNFLYGQISNIKLGSTPTACQ